MLSALKRRHSRGPGRDCIAARIKALNDEAMRVCLSDTRPLARLVALERRHRGSPAGECLADRIEELRATVGETDLHWTDRAMFERLRAAIEAEARRLKAHRRKTR